MTSWPYPISWSKFKLALDCPLQLEYVIEKRPPSDVNPNYYGLTGIVVQKVFELYFNQGLNKKPQAQTLTFLDKALNKVLESKWYTTQPKSYPHMRTEEDLKTRIREQVHGGWKCIEEADLLGKTVVSEQKWRATVRGMRLFGVVDFTVDQGGKSLDLWDGKGHYRTDADERQILFYLVMLLQSGFKVQRAGFLYWNHGVREVDIALPRVKEFLDGDFKQGKEIFDNLRQGGEQKATPSKKVCGWCSWKSTCTASAYRKTEKPSSYAEEVKFGDLEGSDGSESGGNERTVQPTNEVIGGNDRGAHAVAVEGGDAGEGAGRVEAEVGSGGAGRGESGGREGASTERDGADLDLD